MNIRSALLTAVAANALLVHPAFAATHRRHHATGDDDNASLRAEVETLKSELEALKSEMQAQKSAQADTAAQVQTTQNQVQDVQAKVAAAPAVTSDQINTQIASAIEKEHHNDRFYFKGITITPGGFLEMAGIYRQHTMLSDVATAFQKIPFPAGNTARGVAETRFSARQSRLSFLAQGKVNPHVTLGMYGEFDFLGAAQTANSNESNSYNPRIRHLYATIDWDKGDSGLHLLAGQNWSLVTMNTKGITPRNELTPPQIDAQYVPGFVWARQPQIRLTGDFLDHRLWVAVSAENPQTNGAAGAAAPGFAFNAAAGSGYFGNNFDGNGNVKLSYNTIPDIVGKVAYEGMIDGHSLHLEAFGLYRNFTDHSATLGNVRSSGGGVGGGVVFQAVPKVLDLQFSGMYGKGIGRYGSAQLPEITSDANGKLHGIKELMLLAGATVHANKMLDIYGFAGEEQEYGQYLGGSTTLGGYGVGLPSTLDTAVSCYSYTGSCSGDTRRVRQLTLGVWDKIYSGSFGRAQIGLQYSYTERQLFADTKGNMAQVGQNMGFLSIRYYPF